MDELTIDEKVYVSSKRAAKITGYAKDYVGQLCREGRVDARLVGRNWYVLEASIMEHRFGTAPKEQEQPAASVMEKSEPALQIASPVSETWEAPVYEPEVPVVLPTLQAKESVEVEDTRKVVSEMQEAWQEWFREHKPVTQELPDGESEFDGHLTPALVEDGVHEPEEEAVSITRLNEDAHEVYSKPAATNESEEVVHLHKAEVQEVVGEVEDLRPSRSSQSRGTYTQGSSLVLKSLFVGIAFIAVCVALAGTGIVGDTLAASGIAQPLVDAVGGSWEYKSIK